MEKEQLIALIKGYWAGTLDPAAESVFLEWYKNAELGEITALLDESGVSAAAGFPRRPSMSAVFSERLDREIQTDNDMGRLSRMRRLRQWSVAASIILLLGVSGVSAWFILHTKNTGSRPGVSPQIVKTDLAPAKAGAVLTLANGEKIGLDSSKNGYVGQQGNATIRNADGQLSYSAASGTISDMTYNTLTTGRGNQYALVLPDGSKAWLNAASSIQYPTAFAGKEREVRVSGEVYFEIAANAVSPFIIKMTGTDQRIAVLGTRFNVNAYVDEGAIRTTLLDGKVQVVNGTASVVLQPGSQAISSREVFKLSVDSSVNLVQVMAWKNGLFRFERADIRTVMRQIARWYDVDVDYEGTITEHFGGTIPRNVNVSQVLQMLEMTGAAHFVIDGKKIKVFP